MIDDGTRSVRWAAELLLAAAATGAHATTLLATTLSSPNCFDVSAEGLRDRGTGLSTYTSLAAYVQRASNARGAAPVEYRCEGETLRFRAEASAGQARVASFYRATGRPHLQLEFGNEGLHGIAQGRWPNGRPQFVRYYCNGELVGYERHHDEQGRLIAIADHTLTDYRPGGHAALRQYFDLQGSQFHGLPSLRDSRPVYIRMLYRVRGGRLEAPSLQWPGFDGYETLDPASRLEQRIQPGRQGPVTLWGRKLMLLNPPLEYRPFREVVQRLRSGEEPADPVTEGERKLLACPWLADALKPPVQDARLAWTPLPPVDAAQRSATPRARYLACIERPSPACLVEEAAEEARRPDSHDTAMMLGAAAAALAVRQAATAQRALEGIFAKQANYTLPNPLFAVPTLARAEAALQAGNRTAADDDARTAVQHAARVAPHYSVDFTYSALAHVGPWLARLGWLELARQVQREQQALNSPAEVDTLVAIGLAHAHAGRTAEAQAAREALLGWRESRADARGPKRTNRWYSVTDGRANALAAMAYALAARGDKAAAEAMLAEARFARGPRSGSDRESQFVFARAHARLGQGETARQELSPLNEQPQERHAAIARDLCAAGNTDAGLAHLELVRRPWSNFRANDVIVPMAAVAAALSTCGHVDEANALFEEARGKLGEVRDCVGDVCSNFRQSTADRLATEVLDAGRADLLAQWRDLSLSSGARVPWAEALARHGDVAAARKMLEPARQLLQESPALRAREAMLLGQRDEALAIASGLDREVLRGEALLALARSLLTARDLVRGSHALALARASFDEALAGPASAPGMDFSGGAAGLARVAQAYVEAGSFEEARRTADIFLDPPGSLAARERARRGAERIAAALQPDGGAAGAADLAYRGLANSFERRVAIGRSAAALREARGSTDEATLRLRRLVQQAGWIADPRWQARALCELGATADHLGMREDAASLFAQGLARLPAQRQSFPLDPSPAGACAWWLRHAGDANRAASTLRAALDPLRVHAAGNARTATFQRIDSGTLMDSAIVLHEAESGELAVDWLRGPWRP